VVDVLKINELNLRLEMHR